MAFNTTNITCLCNKNIIYHAKKASPPPAKNGDMNEEHTSDDRLLWQGASVRDHSKTAVPCFQKYIQPKEITREPFHNSDQQGDNFKDMGRSLEDQHRGTATHRFNQESVDKPYPGYKKAMDLIMDASSGDLDESMTATQWESVQLLANLTQARR